MLYRMLPCGAFGLRGEERLGNDAVEKREVNISVASMATLFSCE